MTNSRKKLAKKIAKKTGVSHQGATNMMRRPRCLFIDHLFGGKSPVYASHGQQALILKHLDREGEAHVFETTDPESPKLILPIIEKVSLPKVRELYKGVSSSKKSSCILAWKRNSEDRLFFDIGLAHVDPLYPTSPEPLWLRSPKPEVGTLLSYLGSPNDLMVIRELREDSWVGSNFWHRGDTAVFPLNEIATHWVERFPVEVWDETGERRTDFPGSFSEMLDQIQDFCREHPEHDLLSADDPRDMRMGWSAFHPDKEDVCPRRHWTIRLSSVRSSVSRPDFRDLMRSSEGRKEIARRLKEGAFWGLHVPEDFHRTEKAAFEAMTRLAAEEPIRDFILADNPETGLHGVLSFLPGPHENEEDEKARHFSWPVVGDQPLTPKYQHLKTFDELEAFINEPGDIYPCDNPKKLLVGAVRYDVEEGASDIRLLSISNLKATAAPGSVQKWEALRAKRSDKVGKYNEGLLPRLAQLKHPPVPEVVNPAAIVDPDRDPMVKLPEETIMEYLDRTVEVERVYPEEPAVGELNESRREGLAKMGMSQPIPFDKRTPNTLYDKLDLYLAVKGVRNARREGWDVEINDNPMRRTIGFRAEKDGQLTHWQLCLTQVREAKRDTPAQKYFVDLFRWSTGRRALIKSDNVEALHEYLEHADLKSFDYSSCEDNPTYEDFDCQAAEILAVLRGEREVIDETHLSDDELSAALEQKKRLEGGVVFPVVLNKTGHLLDKNLEDEVHGSIKKACLLPSEKISLQYLDSENRVWGSEGMPTDIEARANDLLSRKWIVSRAWQLHRNQVTRGTYPGLPYENVLPGDEEERRTILEDREEWSQKGVFERFGRPVKLVVRLRSEGNRPLGFQTQLGMESPASGEKEGGHS